MDQLRRLVVDEVAEALVVVSQGVDGNSGVEVDVAPVLNVIEVGALASGKDLQRASVRCDHVLEVSVYEGCGRRVCRGVIAGELHFFLPVGYERASQWAGGAYFKLRLDIWGQIAS